MKVSDEIREQILNHYLDQGPEERLKLALSMVVPCQKYIEANGASEDALNQGSFLVQGGLRLLGRATLEGEDFSRLPVNFVDRTFFEVDAPNLPALLRQVRDIVVRLRAAEAARQNAEIERLVRAENQEVERLVDDPAGLTGG